MTGVTPPERIQWVAMVIVSAALVAWIAAVSLVIGFADVRNWAGVAITVGVSLLLLAVGLVAQRVRRRHP